MAKIATDSTSHADTQVIEQNDRPSDFVGDIIALENGDLSALQTLELFAHLIKTGTAWTLQGSYGRTANAFLEEGLIDPDGTITEVAFDRLAEFPEED